MTRQQAKKEFLDIDIYGFSYMQEVMNKGDIEESDAIKYNVERVIDDIYDNTESYINGIIQVNKELAQKYYNLTSNPETKKLCKVLMNPKEHPIPIDKSSRFLGYIQCLCIQEGLFTVLEERDFTRPLFHKVYKDSGISKPESITC
jgi:hypothetical protein